MAWWDLCFDELYLRLFRTILTPDRTMQEVAGVITMLHLRPGRRILDLCCGQGRHSIALAEAGYVVSGLDRSMYLLAQAQQEADRRGTGVHWVQGDMRRLPWEGQFDACINMFTAFGYFQDEDENQQVLHQVCRVLKPGGKLLLDLSNRDYYLLRLWPRAWRQEGEAIVLEETSFDVKTCRFKMTFTWIEGDRRESLTHTVRHYTVPELSGMLRRAGFVLSAIYGDFDQSEFDERSKRLIVVAQRE
jgi:ubiquinone/menaquinone biosynthesis C-methylase UbiE